MKNGGRGFLETILSIMLFVLGCMSIGWDMLWRHHTGERFAGVLKCCVFILMFFFAVININSIDSQIQKQTAILQNKITKSSTVVKTKDIQKKQNKSFSNYFTTVKKDIKTTAPQQQIENLNKIKDNKTVIVFILFIVLFCIIANLTEVYFKVYHGIKWHSKSKGFLRLRKLIPDDKITHLVCIPLLNFGIVCLVGFFVPLLIGFLLFTAVIYWIKILIEAHITRMYILDIVDMEIEEKDMLQAINNKGQLTANGLVLDNIAGIPNINEQVKIYNNIFKKGNN